MKMHPVYFTIGCNHLDKDRFVFSPQSEILQEGLCSLQHHSLDTGDALEALHGCLDPSILSLFEDCTNGEVKPCFITCTEKKKWITLHSLVLIIKNVLWYDLWSGRFKPNFFFFRLKVVLMKKVNQHCSQLWLKYLTM